MEELETFQSFENQTLVDVNYYLWLLFGGPQEGDMALTIQVTGQKIVAYAALITVFILAYGAYQKQAEI